MFPTPSWITSWTPSPRAVPSCNAGNKCVPKALAVTFSRAPSAIAERALNAYAVPTSAPIDKACSLPNPNALSSINTSDTFSATLNAAAVPAPTAPPIPPVTNAAPIGIAINPNVFPVE